MSDRATSSVRSSIIVNAPIGTAFAAFTDDIGSWWPPEHHILEAELAEMVFEPRVGGHVYDRGVDGSECRWARVLAYDPPHMVLISWDISLQWQLERDPDRTSEVEVRFFSETPQRTRVELEHRNIERHGVGWEQMSDSVGSPEGWSGGLRRFAEWLDRRAAPADRLMGFVFRLIPPRPDFASTMSDEERTTMIEHFGYWSGLVQQGKALAFGPVDDPDGRYGIGIVLAENVGAAEALRDGDPVLISRHGFRTEIAPMSALVTPSGRFDRP
jgi:uncharacterized protein YndB with AHSA1/START domain